MRIKIWASLDPRLPSTGPYKAIDIVERSTAYSVGDMTHYGPVIMLPPFADEESDLSVIVQLNPASLSIRPDESVSERPPSSYQKVQLFPIHVASSWFPDEDPPPQTPCAILEAENLTVANVSPMLTADTFSLWRQDCELSRSTSDALQNLTFAIVHRYSSPTDRDSKLDEHSAKLVNSAVECLALIRPTRRSRAGKITGVIKADGMFDPQTSPFR